jgi:hypothetical protein
MSIFEIGDDYLDAVDMEAEPSDDWDSSGDGDAALALRLALHDDYADASDEEIESALTDVMGAMSPAEAFNFGSALNQISRSAGQVLSDPAFASVARTALPIAGGALGTVIGGPVGTAVGSQLGTVAAKALPTGGRPAAPGVAVPAIPAGIPAVPGVPVAPAVAGSPVAGGSAAAAQGLVLTQQPQVLQALLAAALGRQGQQQVGGIPVAQLLGMLSHVMGQAAADADELMYLDGEAADGESLPVWSSDGADRALYTGLLDADNLDLDEALALGGLP